MIEELLLFVVFLPTFYRASLQISVGDAKKVIFSLPVLKKMCDCCVFMKAHSRTFRFHFQLYGISLPLSTTECFSFHMLIVISE